MEEKLSFTFQPTLQHASMAAIAIHLWIEDDSMAYIPNVEAFSSNQLIIINAKVRQKVRHLLLPNPLKERISVFIVPVGKQIAQWYHYLRHEFSLHRVNPVELRWTSKGTVDIRKSALVLVRDQSLDVLTSYRLACTYCLTGEMHDLLTKMSEKQVRECANNPRQKLVLFWTCFSKNKWPQLRRIIDAEERGLSLEQYAFKRAVLSLNPAAAEYFFHKLSSAEQETAMGLYPKWVMEDCRHYLWSKNPSVPVPRRNPKLFSLSRMNPEQRKQLFRKCAQNVLECFLHWPYTGLLVESANRMWEFISDDDFQELLGKMMEQFEENKYDGAVYAEVLREFWSSSPLPRRKYVINADSVFDLVCRLFDLGEKEMCRMMLNEADAEEKRRLISECAASAEQSERIKKLVIQHPSLAEGDPSEEFLQILDNILLDRS